MEKERFDQLFESAVENAVNNSKRLIEMKERFIQIEDKKKTGKSHKIRAELIMGMKNRAAFMDSEQLSTNPLPITDETIMFFLNPEEGSVKEDDC